MRIEHKPYKILIIYLLLASATLAVYWQVHKFDFVYFDDPIYVSENHASARSVFHTRKHNLGFYLKVTLQIGTL